MINNLKEINKEFSLAKKHFNAAIEMAKKSIIVGEITFPEDKPKGKAGRPKGPSKKKVEADQEQEELPDLDKGNKFYGEKKPK